MLKALRICLLHPVILTALGCSHNSPPPPIIPTSAYQYPHRIEQSGLVIAADPYVEHDRLMSAFRADLLDVGVLPVLIVVENHRPVGGCLICKEEFGLALPGGATRDAIASGAALAPQHGWAVDMANISSAMCAVAPLAPVALIPALAGVPAGKDIANINITNQAITNRALIDRTLFPGESDCGFVYFRVRQRADIGNLGPLTVRVSDLVSGREIIFTVDLK